MVGTALGTGVAWRTWFQSCRIAPDMCGMKLELLRFDEVFPDGDNSSP
jgi:hypothetical protein